MSFCQKMREIGELHNVQEDADILISHYKSLIERKYQTIYYGDPGKISENERFIKNLDIIVQSTIHRCCSILDAVVFMFDAGSVYGFTLLCRGHFESCAFLGYICDKLQCLINKTISFDELNLVLAKSIISSTHESFVSAEKPVNIITCIQKSDRYLERVHGINVRFMLDSYAWLSDFCHPNFLSNSCAFYLDRENKAFRFRSDGFSQRESNMIGYMCMSCRALEILLDDIDRMKPNLL